MPKNNSQALYTKACRLMPGGVNSPVRAFKSVGGTPLFIDSAYAARIRDADGKDYLDYVGSWGPLIIGHAHPEVVAAVTKAAQKGLSFGAPTEIEIRMAEKICSLMPNIEMVRLVNSGSEATMSAIRLARAYTERPKIIKLEGCYHGHVDSLLAQAGSGVLSLSIPTSPGVNAAVIKDTLLAPYNDSQQIQKLFAQHGSNIAAVIVEPIAGNMGFIRGQDEFVHSLRRCCDEYNSLLIFDEVMSGFRVALEGAQSLYSVRPDLITLGKVIGGGLPVGAFGGRAEIMSQLAPSGSVYQAGTLSGNPVTLAAGLKTLEIVSKPDFFASLAEKTQGLCRGLETAARRADIPFCCDWQGGMFGFFFAASLPHNLEQAQQSNQNLFRAFYHAMLQRGFYFAPSAFECGFVSSAHQQTDIDASIAAAQEVFQQLRSL